MTKTKPIVIIWNRNWVKRFHYRKQLQPLKGKNCKEGQMLLMLLHEKKNSNEVEKQIQSGNYIKPDEQRLLYQELDVSSRNL